MKFDVGRMTLVTPRISGARCRGNPGQTSCSDLERPPRPSPQTLPTVTRPAVSDKEAARQIRGPLAVRRLGLTAGWMYYLSNH